MISITTDFTKTEREPCVWDMYVSTIYSAQSPETLEKLLPIWKTKITDDENIVNWWEMIKYEIKQLTIETSRALKFK